MRTKMSNIFDLKKNFNLISSCSTPPEPAWVPLRCRTGRNLWAVSSAKIGREVYLASNLEREHWVLVESNPQVRWYCQHYPKVRVLVGETWVTTIYDMLICWENGRLELREIKERKNATPQQDTRVWCQLEAQRLFSQAMEVDYQLLTEEDLKKNPLFLANWHEILGYLNGVPQDRIISIVLRHIEQVVICSLGELIDHFFQMDQEVIKRATAFLLHQGVLVAPLETYPWNRGLPLRRWSWTSTESALIADHYQQS